jgi:hypothetical protein
MARKIHGEARGRAEDHQHKGQRQGQAAGDRLHRHDDCQQQGYTKD